jgi:hypothetical protein
MEDIALGVDERGKSEYCDADDNGRFGVNGMRDGLGVGGGAIVVVVQDVGGWIPNQEQNEISTVAKRSHDSNHNKWHVLSALTSKIQSSGSP